MFACPNCNGALKFDIPSQKLLCENCGSSIPVSQYSQQNNAEEGEYFGATIFTCRNCGAEIISPDESIVGFCSYCGSEQVLESRIEPRKKPARIIPFRYTKQDTRRAFTNKARLALYAPKEYRDGQFLEKFRGIYIPYWTYDIAFKEHPTLTAKKSYRRGDYVYEEEYRVETNLDGLYGGIPYDASSAFDDVISEELAPFHSKYMRPFDPAYLAGFYADQADVSENVYHESAKNKATEQAIQKINKAVGKSGLSIAYPEREEQKNYLLGTHIISHEATLFPVWFLTWRRKDRVAYAVVNGETGRISADIPVDLSKYFIGTVVTAVGLFFVLNLFVSMTASTALLCASIMALVIEVFFLREIKAIRDRELHVFDRGYFVEGSDAPEAPKAKKKPSKSEALDIFEIIVSILVIVFCVLPVVVEFIAMVVDANPQIRAMSGELLVLIAAAVVMIRCFKNSRSLSEKGIAFQSLPAFAGCLAAGVILFFRPVSDIWYYGGCIVCLLGVLFTSISLIGRYNLYATRKLPNFFDRKGGDDSEKD